MVKTILLVTCLIFLSDYMNFSTVELNRSISNREQSIVPAHTDIRAGEELCSALPNDNRAGLYSLAAEQLHASILGVAVSAVSGRTLSLFMCHIYYLCFGTNIGLKSIEVWILTTLLDIVQRNYRFFVRC